MSHQTHNKTLDKFIFGDNSQLTLAEMEHEMAQVIYQFIGGDKERITADTVAQLKQKLDAQNYTVTTINDEVLSDEDTFQDYDFVVLTSNDKSA
jgi:hypothetical protein